MEPFALSIRPAFVTVFGEGDATAIEAAAESHKNGIHDNPGSDYFRWAIAICIGYQCWDNESYREHHGIAADPAALRDWIYWHGDLINHDGDVDYLGVMVGVYEGYVNHDAMSVHYNEDNDDSDSSTDPAHP